MIFFQLWAVAEIDFQVELPRSNFDSVFVDLEMGDYDRGVVGALRNGVINLCDLFQIFISLVISATPLVFPLRYYLLLPQMADNLHRAMKDINLGDDEHVLLPQTIC